LPRCPPGVLWGHVLTYHLCMAVLVLPFWHDRWALLGFVISATTHGFIDRRCPVRWLLRRTGSASFSEIQLGVLSADQAPCILPCSDGRAVSGDSMRSTRARLLRQDQLLVERDAVHKITEVDHAVPHNTVIAEVTNQVTGEESTRTLRWDEHVTTKNRSRSRSAGLARSRWNLCSSLTKKIGTSTATRSPTAPLESIMRERIYIWVRDCAPTTRSRRRRSLASCGMPAKRIRRPFHRGSQVPGGREFLSI
jgi:hypothetical protein